jgi:hypothetical protein
MAILTDYQKNRIAKLQKEINFFSKLTRSDGSVVLPLTMAARKRAIETILKESEK